MTDAIFTHWASALLTSSKDFARQFNRRVSHMELVWAAGSQHLHPMNVLYISKRCVHTSEVPPYLFMALGLMYHSKVLWQWQPSQVGRAGYNDPWRFWSWVEQHHTGITPPRQVTSWRLLQVKGCHQEWWRVDIKCHCGEYSRCVS